MVLNFGLETQDSSRHLSISNHNVRSINKKGKPRQKKRHASYKDYEDSSDEESVSHTDSIDSDADFNADMARLSVEGDKAKCKGKEDDSKEGKSSKAAQQAAAVAQIRSNLNTGE